jgi:penicillin-binding protein 2
LIREFLLKAWKVVRNRLFILLVIIICVFSILINKVFDLQIVKGQNLTDEFSIKTKKNLVIEGTRGNIYDRNGVPLAENELSYSVIFDDSIVVDDRGQMLTDLVNTIEENGDNIIIKFPIMLNKNGVFEFTGSKSSILRFKKDLFGSKLSPEKENMTAEDIINYMRRKKFFDMPKEKYSDEDAIKILGIRYALFLKRGSKFRPLKIAVNISDKTMAMINENQHKFPGAKIVVEPRRIYYDSTYFSHILGYTGKISPAQLEKLKGHDYNALDIVGKSGIEKEMEIYLRGTDGKQTVQIDNLGRTRKIISTQEPKAGKDIFLTIDKELQMKSYDALEQQLANVIASKIYINDPKKKKDIVILLKDVFTSLFENEIISIDELANSSQGYQEKIYNSFVNNYNYILKQINNGLTYDTEFSPENDIYFDYIIDNLVDDGILLTRKKVESHTNDNDEKDNNTGEEKDKYEELKVYTKYKNNEISIFELLNSSIKEKSISIVIDEKEGETPSNIEIYNYIKEYISEEILSSSSFQHLVYAQMSDNNKFNYRDLCLMLIEQNIVSSSEEEINRVKSGKLKPIDFIKKKIINLDLKPKELALDPSTGSAVVVNVNTGEVLSLVSYPSYDNNKLVNDFDNAYYNKLLRDPTLPLTHRATKERRAPGSTFKMVSAMAGLEEGVVNKDTIIRDLGSYKKIWGSPECWIYRAYGSTHGNETVAEALRDSCNYYFYEVGFRLGLDNQGKFNPNDGINKLKEYVTKFGLDSKSGIELSEYSPKSPTSDPVRSAIGQGTNNYAPIQIARYISTLANGGTNFELNVIDKISDNNGEIFEDRTPYIATKSYFKPENIKTVHSGMLMVTSPGGTAASIFKDLPIKVAGKTGTSQETEKRPNHATFTAFAPYDKPEIAVVVVIPYGYTSQNSGKVVKEIIASYYDIYGEVDKMEMDNTLEY